MTKPAPESRKVLQNDVGRDLTHTLVRSYSQLIYECVFVCTNVHVGLQRHKGIEVAV